jgi:hypothetical protein
MNRDHVIAYLLHQMPEPERLQFAEQWMADPALYDEVRMAEDELLDAYVRQEVSVAQRSSIERYLLASESQRRKLAFAQALGAKWPAEQRRRPAWSLLAAAAAAVLASSIAIWLATENAALRRQTTASVVPPQPSMVASFFLPAAIVRGSATEDRVITLTDDNDVLRLELELEPADATGTYSALVSQSGSAIWRGEPIRPVKRGESVVATVWIPARTLSAGRYEVALRAGAADIGYYEFRVARQ